MTFALDTPIANNAAFYFVANFCDDLNGFVGIYENMFDVQTGNTMTQLRAFLLIYM